MKCRKIYRRFCAPLNVDKKRIGQAYRFPFPFNDSTVLWGQGYPEEYLIEPGYVNSFGTWRSIWLHWPRIKFHGVYVAKTKYFRVGEGAFDKPVHLIRFFRYLRFYPDGSLVCITSNNKLRNP
jgi:hypothetical protein